MNECIRRWEIAEELYLSLINKEPFEQLKNKITAHIDAENSSIQNTILKTIYYISMAVSDEDTFDKIYLYLKKYGINYMFFDNSVDHYRIYKFFSQNETDKDIAINNKYGHLFPGTIPLTIIAAIKNSSVEELHSLMSHIYNNSCINRYNIDEYIYYLAAKGNIELVTKICQACGIGMAAALNIAIGYPNLLYGCLKEKYFSKLPVWFRYGNKLRTIEEIIPFLFRSKRFFYELDYGNEMEYHNIISYLHRTVGDEHMKKISKYLPKLKTISVSDMVCFMKKTDSSPEYHETVLNNIGRQVTLTGRIYTYCGNNKSTVIKFYNNYLNSKVCIDYMLLHNILDNEPELINYFLDKGAELKITSEEKHSLIKSIIAQNNADAAKQLIKTDLLNSDTLDEAIKYAVHYSALKVLKLLNEQYSLISDSHIDKL